MANNRFIALVGALFCLVGSISFVHADGRDAVIEEFLTPLVKGKSELAFDKLTKASTLLHADKSLLDAVKREYTTLGARAGRLLGFEKISEESSGSSLRRLKYLMRGEKLPIIWDFVLYDGGADGSWQVIEIKCQSQIMEPSGNLAKSGLQ